MTISNLGTEGTQRFAAFAEGNWSTPDDLRLLAGVVGKPLESAEGTVPEGALLKAGGTPDCLGDSAANTQERR